jgi:hypothetical protein
MSKLVDLKLPKSKTKEGPVEVAADRPQYPYGLQLRLDNDTIQKLGIDDMPKVGDTFELEGKAVVTSVSQNESKGETRRSIELQLTKCCLEGEGNEDDTADSLYKKAK